MTLVDIEAAALELDLPSRAQLAKRLLHSIDNPSPAELEALWIEEAIRRNEAIDAGRLSTKPAEQVFQELRAKFK